MTADDDGDETAMFPVVGFGVLAGVAGIVLAVLVVAIVVQSRKGETEDRGGKKTRHRDGRKEAKSVVQGKSGPGGKSTLKVEAGKVQDNKRGKKDGEEQDKKRSKNDDRMASRMKGEKLILDDGPGLAAESVA